MTKRDSVLQLLNRLYFLPPQEREIMSEKIRNAPEVTLDRIDKALRNGIEKQDEAIRKITERKPEFPEVMEGYMKGKYEEKKQRAEQQDQDSADTLFDSP